MKKKFTLIELLVVIAIIGILSSMLLPSLKNARKKAIEALSINNLKQIYMGMTMYADENNEFVPSSTNFETNRHWPFYIYQSMTGETFPSNNTARQEMMENSSYADVMYCPIVSDFNGGKSFHNMGRTDYGLNRYFNAGSDYDDFKKFSVAQHGGKVEPLIVPIQNPSNPTLWKMTLETHNKAAAYYFGINNKTIGLFISGNVKYITLGEGASMHSSVSNESDFE